MVKVPSLNGGRNARGSSAARADRRDDRQQRDRHEQPLPGEGAFKQRAVGALERAHEPALAALPAA